MLGFLESLVSAGLLLSTFGLVGLLIYWTIKNDGKEEIKEQIGLFKMRDYEAEQQKQTEDKLRTLENRLHDQDFRS